MELAGLLCLIPLLAWVLSFFITTKSRKTTSYKWTAMLTNPAFWASCTLSFPAEHFLWEKVYPFYIISKFLGL